LPGDHGIVIEGMNQRKVVSLATAERFRHIRELPIL
jgi:hypothetical protein